MAKNPEIINPTVKFHTLQDGENAFKLVFTLNALATAESLTKLNLLQALNITDMSVSSLRGLLYATLLKFHPKMTIEQAGDLLQRVGIKPALEAVFAAWSASQPDTDPNVEPEEKSEPALNVN